MGLSFYFVYDVINEKICLLLNDLYELKVSKINTRNNSYMVKLPKTRLECGRLSLKFMGAKIFNDLPLEIRKQCSDKSFKSSLKSYLASNYFFFTLALNVTVCDLMQLDS